MANPIRYDDTSDVKKQAQNQRARAAGQGDVLLQQDQDRLAEEERRRNRYTDPLDQLYEGDAAGYGGYNDEERRRILGEEGLSDLQLTDAERQANYLTGDEQAAARGDTGSYERFFNPGQMDQDLRVAQGRQGQAINDYDQNLRKSVDAGQLKQSETYRGNSRNILDQNRRGFEGTYNAVGDRVRGAIDPSLVTTSDQFLQDYQMSPEEQQDLVTSAGISAGVGNRALAGETMRRGQAAGASPLGIAAFRARQERDAGAAAGDAMTLARVRASEAAAGRQLTGEQLRQQGGRYLTDVKTGTEMGLGQQALRGQEQLGQQALSQENTMEQNRQNAEQFLTGANMDVARTSGDARIRNAQLETQQGQQQAQYAATTGTNIAQAQDRDAAQRALDLSKNRQATEQYNQEQRYGRGMAANTATSQRGTTVGNTRLGQQTQARNYFTGQSDQANQNAEAARQRQQQSYSTSTSGTNDATRTGVQAQQVENQRPRLWEKIANTAIGAVSAAGGAGLIPKQKADGGVITEPTLAVVGEDGPEMITPLDYRKSAQVRPSMAMQPQRRSFFGQA